MISVYELNILLDKECDKAFNNICGDVNKLYSDYSKNAQKLISAFHIDLGNEKFDTKNPMHKVLLNTLDNDMDKLTDTLFTDIQKIFDNSIDKLYDSCYNMTSTSLTNPKQIDSITMSAIKNTDIENPWSGVHYRDRLKNHNDRLKFTIKSNLNSSISREETFRKNYEYIHTSLDSQLKALERLSKNEFHVCRIQSQLSCYESNGIRDIKISKGRHEYDKVHTMKDPKVCGDCRQHEGKIVRVKDRKPGLNVPLFHVGCRCWCEPIIIHDVYSPEEFKKTLKK